MHSNEQLLCRRGKAVLPVDGQSRRAGQSPLEHLRKLNAATDRKHDRRSLSSDEVRRLLATAYHGPVSFGVAGPERRLLYLLALQSGIRANELRNLTRSSFDFRPNPATVVVQARSSKRRRLDTLPLLADTATELMAHLAAKHPGAAAFSLPSKFDMVEMVKADLSAARAAWLQEAGTPDELAKREQTSFLAYEDDAGCFADFHALRHTFLTNLARSGVHPKVAQALARHSTITLTMDRYSHTVLGEQSEAVEALPDFSASTLLTEHRATGTDNVPAANIVTTVPKPATMQLDQEGGKTADDDGLSTIIRAWPDLPETTRRAIWSGWVGFFTYNRLA